MNILARMLQRRKLSLVFLVGASLLFMYAISTNFRVSVSPGDEAGHEAGARTGELHDAMRTEAQDQELDQTYSQTSYSEELSESINLRRQFVGNKLSEYSFSKELYEKNGKTNSAVDILSKKTFNISLENNKMEDSQMETALSSLLQKKILFYGNFFYDPWESFVDNMTILKQNNCPETNCIFLYNTSHPESADAVIFHHPVFNKDSVPSVRRPQQRYIWLNLEAPTALNLNDHQLLQHMKDKKGFGMDGFFNWTYSYNRGADLLMLYGGLRSLRGEPDSPRPGLLDTSGATYNDYTAALDRDDHLLDDDPHHHWHAYISRPKTVAWMVSHCSTVSGREFYVKELQQHISVDVYGLCGDLRCGKSHHNLNCYADVLRPKYKFYLAFENNMCQDYITEKVWLPLHYGLVPVVYGGANYSVFLPPRSYIDATELTPAQLANLLIRLSSSPREYSQYHLWRRYWRVLLKPPMCELCWKLHHNHTSTTLYQLDVWWRSVNHCTTRYPAYLYPRPPEPDTRSLSQKLTDTVRLLGVLLGTVMQHNQ